MAKKTKAQKAAEAAVDAATLAVKDAKRLSKSLPKKDAKKLRELVSDAKDAAQASKKKLVAKPRKVEKVAVAATARLEKATAKIEAKAAAKKPKVVVPKPEKASRVKDAPESGVSDAELTTPRPVTPKTPAAPASADLEILTVAALRTTAREAGRTGYSRLTKAQLIALLAD